MDNNEQSKTTLEMVNGLSEIAEFMNDEELTTALTMIAKLIITSVVFTPRERVSRAWCNGLYRQVSCY